MDRTLMIEELGERENARIRRASSGGFRVSPVCWNSDEDFDDKRTILTWPHAEGVNFVEVRGSFTDPPWKISLPLYFCKDNDVWWVLLEEYVQELKPGTHEFKFVIDGDRWLVHPVMPRVRDASGAENNILRIDYRVRRQI